MSEDSFSEMPLAITHEPPGWMGDGIVVTVPARAGPGTASRSVVPGSVCLH